MVSQASPAWPAQASVLLPQVGTAVVTRQDKRLALGRLGSLVEQIEALVSKDRQVILVRPSSAPRCLCGTRRRCVATARGSAAG